MSFVSYCYGCDRPATRPEIIERGWLLIDGHLFCPECQDEMPACSLCGDKNWLGDDWPEDEEFGLVCPACEEDLKNIHDSEV